MLSPAWEFDASEHLFPRFDDECDVQDIPLVFPLKSLLPSLILSSAGEFDVFPQHEIFDVLSTT